MDLYPRRILTATFDFSTLWFKLFGHVNQRWESPCAASDGCGRSHSGSTFRPCRGSARSLAPFFPKGTATKCDSHTQRARRKHVDRAKAFYMVLLFFKKAEGSKLVVKRAVQINTVHMKLLFPSPYTSIIAELCAYVNILCVKGNKHLLFNVI